MKTINGLKKVKKFLIFPFKFFKLHKRYPPVIKIEGMQNKNPKNPQSPAKNILLRLFVFILKRSKNKNAIRQIKISLEYCLN